MNSDRHISVAELRRRGSVLWDVFTDAQWKTRQAAYRAGRRQQLPLAARTADFFLPGAMQPERDHHFNGEKVAMQTLDHNRPGKFFGETYPLPESLTRGKNTVTIRQK